MTYRHRVATVFLFGFFLDLINMFIASIAFPAISRALAVSVSQLAWVSNAYILGLTVVVPFSAWLSERWGAKRLFLLSLGLFSLGALAAGLANSLSELILWRTLQGMGGGLLIPLGQALTWPLFQPHERAKLSAAVMLVGLLAPACSCGDRRPVSRGVQLALGLFRQPACRSANLCAGGAMAERHPRSGSPDSLSSTVAAGRSPAALRDADLPLRAGDVYWRQRGGDVLPATRHRDGAGGNRCPDGALVAGLVCRHHLLGRYFNRFGPRPLVIIGCLLQAMGIMLLLKIDADSPLALLILAFTLMGGGGSLCSSTAQSSAFLHTPAEEMPDASALWNLNRQLSFFAGSALLALLLRVFPLGLRLAGGIYQRRRHYPVAAAVLPAAE